MAAGYDLDVDTDRLRGCAVTLSGAAHDLLLAGRASGESSAAAIGRTPTAVDVGLLLQARTGQAAGAAAQLGAVARAVAEHLQTSADHFERVDAGLRRGAR